MSRPCFILPERRKKVKEAREVPSFGRSIFDYAPNSTGAQNYKGVIVEVLKRVRT